MNTAIINKWYQLSQSLLDKCISQWSRSQKFKSQQDGHEEHCFSFLDWRWPMLGKIMTSLNSSQA